MRTDDLERGAASRVYVQMRVSAQMEGLADNWVSFLETSGHSKGGTGAEGGGKVGGRRRRTGGSPKQEETRGRARASGSCAPEASRVRERGGAGARHRADSRRASSQSPRSGRARSAACGARPSRKPGRPVVVWLAAQRSAPRHITWKRSGDDQARSSQPSKLCAFRRCGMLRWDQRGNAWKTNTTSPKALSNRGHPSLREQCAPSKVGEPPT
ncbi:uncharacterized protein LOC120888918 [Ictidomys tridecemlineatus]